jgi:hypothetical protein
VHGLEGELAGRLRVLRLDVDDAVGQRAKVVYGVEKVPTVILLNRSGSEVYRTEGKLPRRGEIRVKLAEIEATA